MGLWDDRPRDVANFNPEANISAGRVTDLSQQQLTNAAIIYQVGRQLGMSTRDIQIGLITAMVESNLINVNYGDRDSLGLFQQRPSQGWGTPEQVQDPKYAATKFFTALKGLGEERYGMGMGEAAQAVQRSAYPERYAERISAMRAMWPSVKQTAGDPAQSLDGGTYSLPDASLEGMIGAASFGSTGGITSAEVLEQLAPNLNQPLSPTASQMLGAWGMQGTNIVNGMGETAVVDDDPIGIKSLINQSTNAEIIQPLSQTSGGYEQGVDGWRKAVIEYAKTAIGQPYVWGGSNLTSGVDCSGLLYAAFAKAGFNIPRVSYQQANYGTRVGVDALRPGDLYAWDNSSRNPGADHIALYLGNGQILEAAKPGTVVRIRTLGPDEGGWGVQMNMSK